MSLLVEGGERGAPREVEDLELDAVARAADALIDAKTRDLIAQRNAVIRLASVVANNPDAAVILASTQTIIKGAETTENCPWPSWNNDMRGRERTG